MSSPLPPRNTSPSRGGIVDRPPPKSPPDRGSKVRDNGRAQQQPQRPHSPRRSRSRSVSPRRRHASSRHRRDGQRSSSSRHSSGRKTHHPYRSSRSKSNSRSLSPLSRDRNNRLPLLDRKDRRNSRSRSRSRSDRDAPHKNQMEFERDNERGVNRGRHRGPPPDYHMDDNPRPRMAYPPRGGGGGGGGDRPPFRDERPPHPPNDQHHPPHSDPHFFHPPANQASNSSKRRDGEQIPGISLLVRNISPEITSSDLQVAFGRIGQVRDVYIPRDFHSQQQKGFAFVEFGNPHQARDAQEEMHRFFLKGRELEVVFAQERRKTPKEMRGRVVSGEESSSRGGGERDAGGFERSSSFDRYKRGKGR